MGEDFVGDDGGVVEDEGAFDGQGGDFGEENPAECIGYGGVDADEGEDGFIGGVLVDLDGESLAKLVEGPAVVFAWVVAGEVCRGDIGDCFGVDAYNLAAFSKATIDKGKSLLSVGHGRPV